MNLGGKVPESVYGNDGKDEKDMEKKQGPVEGPFNLWSVHKDGVGYFISYFVFLVPDARFEDVARAD